MNKPSPLRLVTASSAAAGGIPPAILSAYQDMCLERLEKLQFLSRLRAQLRELDGRVADLTVDELELGMRLDHLVAQYPELKNLDRLDRPERRVQR